MDQMLDRRMRANKRVTDAELRGIYEMITEHVLPFSYAAAPVSQD